MHFYDAKTHKGDYQIYAKRFIILLKYNGNVIFGLFKYLIINLTVMNRGQMSFFTEFIGPSANLNIIRPGQANLVIDF